MKDSKRFSTKEILILSIQVVAGFLLAFIGLYLEFECNDIMGLCLVPFGVAFSRCILALMISLVH